MKVVLRLVAAAVSLTSPISLATAQASQQECRDNCAREIEHQFEYCRSLGQSLDGEYCYLDVQTRNNACYESCEYQGQNISSLRSGETRFRPVHAETEKPIAV